MKKKDKNIETQSEIRGQTKDAVTIDDTINQPYTDREKKKLRNDITHKLRFEILERDDYTCQYCGRKSPDVELTVDHRKPIAEGGNNDEDNLITACYECNEGKKNKRLKQDIKETDFSNMDKPQISEVILSGKIKEYFLSDESEKNRTLLHEYWKYTEGEETECPQNCESCISIGNRYYMDCFSELKRRAFPNNIITEAVAIRAKVNPIVHKSTLMQCDKCYLGDRCPLFKVAAECSYDFTLNTNFTDTESAWEIIANAQKERMSRALLFEKVDGGVADKNVSDEIDRMANILGNLDERQREKLGFKLTVEGSGQLGSGGTVGQLIKTALGLDEDKDKKIPEKISAKKNIKTIEEAKTEVIVEEVAEKNKTS